VLAVANSLLAVAISYGLVVLWRAWRLSPVGDGLQSSAMSLSAAVCDDEPSRCSGSTGALAAFDEPSSHSSHSLGTDASSSNVSSGDAGTLRLPGSSVGSLSKQAASPVITAATAADATRPPRLASVGWQPESPILCAANPPTAPLPDELHCPTGGPTGGGAGGDPCRVQSDLRALIAEIACDASLPNCEEDLPAASLPLCPRNQSPQPPSAPVDFCDVIFRMSISPSEVAISPLPADVVNGPRVPALSPCEPPPELPLPPVATPRAGGRGADGTGRTPAKIGLVAHQPASDILQRTEMETLAALLDSPSAQQPSALCEHPRQPTPPEQPPPPEAARVSSAGGLQTEPSRSSLSSSPPSSSASSPMPSGGPPCRRPPPAPRVSPRITAAIDPMLDELFDLFDQEHAYLDFTEVKVLGRGSFGQAVLMQAPSGVQVVAKKLPLDACSDGELRRLESEVTVCAWLRHPNVCHYLGTLARPAELLIYLEYASGGTLSDEIDRTRAANTVFAFDVAATWIAQMASAIEYMHSKHVLHRDLSATNVFLSSAYNIKVGDFGLSKASASMHGKTVCGTPNYFSPELINGEPYGAASDAWAIGLLAHEILTLHHPFVGTSLAVLMQRILRCEYDEGRLAAMPYPDELKAVAGRSGLLHVDASMRLTLGELLAKPSIASLACKDGFKSSSFKQRPA